MPSIDSLNKTNLAILTRELAKSADIDPEVFLAGLIDAGTVDPGCAGHSKYVAPKTGTHSPAAFLTGLGEKLGRMPADEALHILDMKRLLPDQALPERDVVQTMLAAIRTPDGFRHTSPLSPGARTLLFRRAGLLADGNGNAYLLAAERLLHRLGTMETIDADDLTDRGGLAVPHAHRHSYVDPHATGLPIGPLVRSALALSQHPAATAQHLANRLARTEAAAAEADGQGLALAATIRALVDELDLPAPSADASTVTWEALHTGGARNRFAFLEGTYYNNRNQIPDSRTLPLGSPGRITFDFVSLVNDVIVDGSLSVVEAKAMIAEFNSYHRTIEVAEPLLKVFKKYHTEIEPIPFPLADLEAFDKALRQIEDHPLRKEAGALELLRDWVTDQMQRATRGGRFGEETARMPELAAFVRTGAPATVLEEGQFDYTNNGDNLAPVRALLTGSHNEQVAELASLGITLKAALAKKSKGISGAGGQLRATVLDDRLVISEAEIQGSSSSVSSSGSSARSRVLFGLLYNSHESSSGHATSRANLSGHAQSFEYTGKCISLTDELASLSNRGALTCASKYREQIAPHVAQLAAICQELDKLSTRGELPQVAKDLLEWATTTRIEAKVGNARIVDRYIYEG